MSLAALHAPEIVLVRGNNRQIILHHKIRGHLESAMHNPLPFPQGKDLVVQLTQILADLRKQPYTITLYPLRPNKAQRYALARTLDKR